jgi:aminoglycoside/choline kinase family phosphotransferase/GTP:adenosylcobinamide-phosphate guanylyltransferase
VTTGQGTALPPKRSIDDFLSRAGWAAADRENLAGDASFRRYERVCLEDAQAVLMDAPPPQEDVRPFMAVTRYLEEQGFSAPHILNADTHAGFLLLEDLGDDRYGRLIARAPDLERQLYEAAVDLLVSLHSAPVAAKLPYGTGDHPLPLYDEALLLREAGLFTDWYLPALFNAPVAVAEKNRFNELWRAAFKNLDNQHPVLVLRDYHADNLMWLPERAGLARVGLLDYQDAVIGHAAYDLVSLLQDARRDVSPALEEAMIGRYLQGAAKAGQALDGTAFRTAYAILGAQRNTKIIGIFMRLCLRDGKDTYLSLIPRVWALLERDLAHPALAGLAAWFDEFISPDLRIPAPAPGRPFDLPANAMVLAAGLGTRMRPLTDHLPKPLLEVAGRTMLDRILDHAGDAGVTRAVVNMHFLPDVMESHLSRHRGWPAIIISDERRALLDSGGGVAKALTVLGGAPFYILNSDMIWEDDCFDTLGRLAGAWDDETMDALLLLVPTKAAIGYDGKGDFHLNVDGRLRRRGKEEASDYMFGGIQLIHPRLFAGCPAGAFSLNLLFDKALTAGRLFGLPHSGSWRHVGTPEAYAQANETLTIAWAGK